MTVLYHEHAIGLTRLAHVMLGDRVAAEDVVQEAFTGLFRRWMFLDDAAKAPAYLRSAVLNGCRTIARRGTPPVLADVTTSDGADMALLAAEERHAVLAALRELPDRQREALVLRYFLELPHEEIARSMGIRPGTVRSAVHRGLATLERVMTEEMTR
ncbi:MAG: polymerase, sigma-24 subunit, subfamily [Actinomycetia bacterium]|nr:polymerase, sigma-24 subunit, subfamily [Actinomycetes bacterium]